MYKSAKQNSVGNYQQGFKDGKQDMAFTIFFSMYAVVTLVLGAVGIMKDILILEIISLILGTAIIIVPITAGAYEDYRQSSQKEKKIMKTILSVILSGLIVSILLVLN